MSKHKLAPADVIQQTRTKLKLAINRLVVAASMRTHPTRYPRAKAHFTEQQARVERAISVYTRTVRNAKKK